MGLGALAVLPEHQGQGISSQLVEAGLAESRQAGHEVAIVLGHPEYYPRIGFVPSKPLGIGWENNAPEEPFMVLELKEETLAGRGGVAKFLPEFEGV